MTQHKETETVLNKARPTLSDSVQEKMWQGIVSKLPMAQPIPSPYQVSLFSKYTLAPIALFLVVVVGIGSAGTYAAAESSRPGDFLFPVQRAIEDLRITLATDTQAEELRTAFARKRLLEIQSLIDAELLRLGDDATTTEVVVSGNTGTRIDTGIDALLLLTDGLRTVENRDTIFAELKRTVDDITVRNNDDEYRLRIKDDGRRVEVRTDDDDNRFEIRESDDRIRVREKDGQLRIDVKKDDDKDDDEQRIRSSGTTRIIEEAEADVFSNITRVKVELYSGRDVEFETTAKTRAEVVREIAQRTGASTAEADAVLELKVKDSTSRDDDKDDKDDDDDASRDDDERKETRRKTPDTR